MRFMTSHNGKPRGAAAAEAASRLQLAGGDGGRSSQLPTSKGKLPRHSHPPPSKTVGAGLWQLAVCWALELGAPGGWHLAVGSWRRSPPGDVEASKTLSMTPRAPPRPGVRLTRALRRSAGTDPTRDHSRHRPRSDRCQASRRWHQGSERGHQRNAARGQRRSGALRLPGAGRRVVHDRSDPQGVFGLPESRRADGRAGALARTGADGDGDRRRDDWWSGSAGAAPRDQLAGDDHARRSGAGREPAARRPQLSRAGAAGARHRPGAAGIGELGARRFRVQRQRRPRGLQRLSFSTASTTSIRS